MIEPVDPRMSCRVHVRQALSLWLYPTTGRPIKGPGNLWNKVLWTAQTLCTSTHPKISWFCC